MRRADPERIEHPHRVVGPHLEVIVLLGLLGLAVAALVVVDTAELAAEQRGHRAEVEVTEAGSVDLQDRLTLASDLVPQTRAIDVNEVRSHPHSLLSLRGRRPYMSDIAWGLTAALT